MLVDCVCVCFYKMLHLHVPVFETRDTPMIIILADTQTTDFYVEILYLANAIS